MSSSLPAASSQGDPSANRAQLDEDLPVLELSQGLEVDPDADDAFIKELGLDEPNNIGDISDSDKYEDAQRDYAFTELLLN